MHDSIQPKESDQEAMDTQLIEGQLIVTRMADLQYVLQVEGQPPLTEGQPLELWIEGRAFASLSLQGGVKNASGFQPDKKKRRRYRSLPTSTLIVFRRVPG